jgi:hypothetical protein
MTGSEQEKQMNTATSLDGSTLKKNSPLFWFTLVIPVAIIGIGIDFILNPVGASTGYGIPIHDPAAFPFMWIKGIRDIFAGLVVLPFLWRGDRRTTAILFALSIFVPFGDGLVILSHLGFAPPIFIHWGTALYMMVVSYFLLRKPNSVKVVLTGGEAKEGGF